MNGVCSKHHNNGVNVNGSVILTAADIKATASKEESGLAKIEVPDDNPFVLFREWQKEALESDLALPSAMCLSTATKEGQVSARHVLLRRLEADGFVFMTDRRSKKSAQLAENPYACLTFLWCYREVDGVTINRQVRIEGEVVELTPEQYGDLYEKEPLFCKVRTHLCHQGTQVDWQEHKQRHDDILRKVAEDGMPLPRPDHFAAYKLTPSMMEFYFAHDTYIGDRMMFLKKSGEQWEHTRIAA